MNDRVQKAVKNYNSGYNCAQSILCAYCDLMEMSEAEAYKLGEGFGSGIAGMRDICGAVNAMFMVISYVHSNGEPGSKKSRAFTYKQIRSASDAFKNQYKSIICRDIVFNQEGMGCVKKVEDAAKILEKVLADRELYALD